MVLLGLLVAVCSARWSWVGSLAGSGVRGELQGAADLAALAAARAMRDAYPRVFEPPVLGGVRTPAPRARGVPRARRARGARDRRAQRRARGQRRLPRRRAGAHAGASDRARRHRRRRQGRRPERGPAEAELAPPGADARGGARRPASTGGRRAAPGQVDASRRRAGVRSHGAAARADGVALIASAGSRRRRAGAPCSPRTPTRSGSRRPGRSLHRLGTELDLGPPAAYGGWRRNAGRFGFVQRYSWEPWHYGYARNAGTALASARGGGGDGRAAGAAVVRARALRVRDRPAAQRWSARRRCWPRRSTRSRASTRSRGRPRARRASRSSCRARPRRTGCADPFDADRAIDAQAHLMRDLLGRFAAVPLALAAYNAGRARRGAAAASRHPRDRVLRRRHPRAAARRRRPLGDRAGGLEVQLVR